MMDLTEMNDLQSSLMSLFGNSDKLMERIIYLNRTNRLESFLELLGFVKEDNFLDSTRSKNGKIIVVGESEVTKQCLLAIGKECGISKDRFEFCLSYDEAKRFNFKKTQYSDKYSLIMVGPMPHSSYGSGDFSSALSALRNTDGYPPVVSLGFQSLKITKTNFKNTLEELIRNKILSR